MSLLGKFSDFEALGSFWKALEGSGRFWKVLEVFVGFQKIPSEKKPYPQQDFKEFRL